MIQKGAKTETRFIAGADALKRPRYVVTGGPQPTSLLVRGVDAIDVKGKNFRREERSRSPG